MTWSAGVFVLQGCIEKIKENISNVILGAIAGIAVTFALLQVWVYSLVFGEFGVWLNIHHYLLIRSLHEIMLLYLCSFLQIIGVVISCFVAICRPNRSSYEAIKTVWWVLCYSATFVLWATPCSLIISYNNYC